MEHDFIRGTQPTSSLDGVPVTVQGQMKHGRKLQRKVTTLRDAILEKRTKLEFEQKRSDDYRRFVHESLTNLIEAQSDAMKAGTLTTDLVTIDDLRSTFEQDNSNLQTQDATTKQVQSELSSLEFDLMEEEQKLITLVYTLCSALGYRIDEASSESGVSVEPADAPSESQHPLAQKFYHRKAAIQIIRERIVDLDGRTA